MAAERWATRLTITVTRNTGRAGYGPFPPNFDRHDGQESGAATESTHWLMDFLLRLYPRLTLGATFLRPLKRAGMWKGTASAVPEGSGADFKSQCPKALCGDCPYRRHVRAD